MSSDYSYLDVAVLDPVRERFAAGDALVILSSDLANALWVNGPGAALLGYSAIEEALGTEDVLAPVARRQIMATPGFPEIGSERSLMLRLTAGLTSQAVLVTASTLSMPDGERAILLVAPAHAETPSDGTRALAGFTEDGGYVAFVDGQGRLEAASEGFESLDISTETLAKLVAEVAGERDRLVKRRIQAGARSFPAGLARLVDDPPRHLLVVVDDGEIRQAEPPPAPSVAPAEENAAAVDIVTDERQAEPLPEDEPVRKIEERAGAAERQESPSPARTDPGTEPVRFVWRTDTEGAFSAISPDFVALVGEQAADVIGQRFSDVAAAFGIDPEGEIGQLLERRDTWSGRTVRWPTASGLRIPVDLAALPVYNRDRVFEGFRGFGVARPADATPDPGAAELFLRPVIRPPAPSGTQELPPVSESGQTVDTPSSPDPFQGEVPALTIASGPERRFADKIIRLAEHRPAAGEKGLTSLERNAFREIGERLRKESEAGGEKRASPETETPKAAPTAGEELSGPVARPSSGGDKEASPTAADGTSPVESGRAATGDGDGSSPSPMKEGVADGDSSAARLDTETGSSDASVAEQPAQARPRSLLKYAVRADEGKMAQTPQPEGEAVGRDGGQKSAVQAPSALSSEDSIAAADFADARDDGSLPGLRASADEEAIEPQRERRAATGSAEPADEQTLKPIPPLRTEGIIPSAFAPAERRAPDTSILAKLPVPLLIHAGDTLHYANGEFLDVTGYETLEALVEAGGLDALFADPYQDDSASDRADRVLLLRTADGRELPVQALLRSVPWRGGKALMLVLRRSDVQDEQGATPTARPVAGEPVQPDVAELKARIAEMRTIIDTATDGVVLIGPDGTIRSISRPAEALFGFESDEVAGKPFTSLFAIESQRAAGDYLASLSEPGVASVLNDGREVIGREAQGRFIPLFMTVGRLPGDSGYCAVVRDITQWKRAEEDLTQARALAERASSQKTEFLARISHEIRTPLNAIIGFSELMMDEKFGPISNDRYRDYLRDINRSGNHVLDLVNDLLDISKIEAGQQEMEYEAVSLNDTLAETVAMMQPQANRERVIIRSSLASRLPDVVADLRSVRQIALNILSNAIRYTQAGGQVIVSTAYEPSGDVVMRVRDTGVGMTQAEIEQALKPFKQLNALRRGRGDGTGLGLPLTKAMVEANRAHFSIHSTPGEGTLVEVSFPSTRVLAG